VTLKNEFNLIQKKLQKSKRQLINNRRAVNAVISNLILIAAVIVIGLVAVAYTQNVSSNYQSQYGQTVNNDVNKVKETIKFEYAFYNASTKNLNVYFINSGSVNVNVTGISINGTARSFTLNSINGAAKPTQLFSVGEEGYFVASTTTTLASGTYSTKITTGRGSIFAFNFVV
jgi:hypothetical protein